MKITNREIVKILEGELVRLNDKIVDMSKSQKRMNRIFKGKNLYQLTIKKEEKINKWLNIAKEKEESGLEIDITEEYWDNILEFCNEIIELSKI